MNTNNPSYIEEWKIFLLIVFIALIVFLVTFIVARKIYRCLRKTGGKQDVSELSNVLLMKRAKH